MISINARLIRLLVATSLFLAAAYTIQAQIVFYDWTNASGDNNYLNAANWGLPTAVTDVNGKITYPPNATAAAPTIPGANAQIRLTAASSAYPKDQNVLNLNYTGSGDNTVQIWGLQAGANKLYTINISGTANGWLNYNIIGRGATANYADPNTLQTYSNTGSTSTRLPFYINLGSYSRIIFDNSSNIVGSQVSGLGQAIINMTGNSQMDLSKIGSVAYTYGGATAKTATGVENGGLIMAPGTSVYLGMKTFSTFEAAQSVGETYVLAGHIYADPTNTQAIQKWGSGVTDMTGTFDYAGILTMRAGTYLVDGTHNGPIGNGAGSNMVVGGRGVINYQPAAGTAAVNLGNGVSLAPGGIGTGGNLTINGNVILNGSLNLTLYSATNFSHLTVNGNLFLGINPLLVGTTSSNTSSLSVGVTSSFPLMPGTYRVVDVAPNSNITGSTGQISNGLTSSFAAPTSTGVAFSSVALPISQGLAAAYVMGPNYIDIVFTQLPFAVNPLLTGNHLIIADHIDTAVTRGAVPGVLLDTLNRQPSIILFDNLLDQLSPAVYYSWYPSAVINAHTLTQGLQDRFEQGKARRAGSWDTYTLESRKESSVTASSIADYSNFDTVSVSTGADYAITPDLVIGALLDYSDTHFDLDTWDSHSTDESFTGALYAQHKRGAWRMQVIGFAGVDDYKSSRTVILTNLGDWAVSKTKGMRGGGQLSSSYTFALPWFEVTPNVNFDALYWAANAFRETGAAEADLAVKSQTEFLLSGRAGIRIAQSFPVKHGFIRPFVNVGLQHQFNNGDRTIRADLFGSRMSVKTNGLEANGMRYDLGLDWDMTQRSSLQIRYASESGGVVDESMGVRAGLNMTF